MGNSRTEAVDELVEHELAVAQGLEIVADLLGQRLQVLRLDPAEGLGRHAAASSQAGIGLLPLTQFHGALPLSSAELVDQLLHELILTVLGCQQRSQQACHFRVHRHPGWQQGRGGTVRNVNLAEI